MKSDTHKYVAFPENHRNKTNDIFKIFEASYVPMRFFCGFIWKKYVQLLYLSIKFMAKI